VEVDRLALQILFVQSLSLLEALFQTEGVAESEEIGVLSFISTLEVESNLEARPLFALATLYPFRDPSPTLLSIREHPEDRFEACLIKSALVVHVFYR
jgi:hypothetical protein